GAILGFVGVKMLLTFSAEQFEWPSADFHFPTYLSLGVIALILLVTVVASLAADKRDPNSGPPADRDPADTEAAEPVG
nr:TerC family protein [Actinomycetota bacterium]